MNREKQIEEILRILEEVQFSRRPETAVQWPEQELTMPQMKALVFLHHGPHRMSELAEHLAISYSSATSLVTRMEQKKLVQRRHHEEDRRVVTCELTDDGRATAEEYLRIGQIELQEILKHITDENLSTVLNSMQIIRSAVDRYDRASEHND